MAGPASERRHDADVEAHEAPTEQTPLLRQTSADGTVEGTSEGRPQNPRSASSYLFANISNSGKSVKRRWPSLLALFLLCILAVLIIVFAFLTPSIVEQYAQQAVIFEPTSLSFDSITSDGVRARVQGDFMLDAERVEPKSLRDLGRFGTWIASKAQSGDSTVEVSLPEYGNIVLGTADIPPITVNLRAGQVTHVDFVAALHPGDLEGVRRIANDWIDGRLGQLRVLGKADVPLKSGIFSLGSQKITHELLFANKDIPTIPAYKIQKLNIHEAEGPDERGVVGDISLKVANPYPVELSVPAMGFDILVSNCEPSDPYIKVADATTSSLHIQPKQGVQLNATGYVQSLPDILTQACPGSKDSPLDQLLGGYIRGKKTTVFVKGTSSPSPDTPAWIADLLSSITVPVDVPGKTFGHLIKNFSMAHTQFSLPSPWADPNSPEAQPRISATVRAIIALPEEMNFDLDVGQIRANATVYYKKEKLGILDLQKWQRATSKRLPADDDGPSLLVESALKNVPLYITDDDVFSDVIAAILTGDEDVIATIKAAVDVQINTTLGDFAVRDIPAEGEIPIQPISSDLTPHPPGKSKHNSSLSDLFGILNPRVYDLTVVTTTPDSLTLSALVNFSNPSPYEADIPYISLHVLTNDSIIANASVENVYVYGGNNTAFKGTGTWNPLRLGGPSSLSTATEFLSQYISGYNTTLSFRFHEQSIPANAALSRALSRFNLTIPTPRLPDLHPSPPDNGNDDDDDGGDDDDKHNQDPDSPSNKAPRFIDSARFHLFSSTADFTLRSPLPHDTMIITAINATARYKGHRVGTIEYDEPFAVWPVNGEGEGSETPRLPVVWETGGVGWSAVRRALGGRLKIAAEAVVGIRVGRWTLDGVWFRGRGLGVGVRP